MRNRIDRSDLERVRRLLDVGLQVLDCGNTLLSKAIQEQAAEDEEAFARLSALRDERRYLWQFQIEITSDLGRQLRSMMIEADTTRTQLAEAVDRGDINVASGLSGRLSALQMSISSLDTKLNLAERELATRGDWMEVTVGHIATTRALTDRQIESSERFVAEFWDNVAPTLATLRAAATAAEDEDATAPEPETPRRAPIDPDKKTVHLTRDMTGKSFEVFRRD